MRKKGNNNMYDVILKEKNNLYSTKNNLSVHTKKEIPDDLIKYTLSQQMSDEIYSDVERMASVMVKFIVGGIFSGRK